MNQKTEWILALLVGMTLCGLPALGSDVDLQAEIDASKTGEPIHRYVYGQFTELLGNMFENGLWAETLSDRKFFYPVDSSAELNPPNTKRWVLRWRPIGPDEFVVMDREQPYVGEHTPRITLEGTTPHGIQQTGLGLLKDKEYSGRIVLKGDPKANVEVRLVWGANLGDHQTVSIGALTSEYVKYPLAFTSGMDATDGRLEIIGTGSGSFHIGAVSLMPADNLNGFRADLIQHLRELDSGIYRWPGGNMVSGYDWRDGIGDRDRRPPRYEYAWRTVESNDVGTDEFIALCRLLSIDPYLCVNAGFGDAHSAAQWVQYANGSVATPMGKLRAANGHPEPYNVLWWGIGNEMYGQWQLGHMSIGHYCIKHNMFTEAMRKVDPKIKIIASGATPFETSTTARHHRRPLPAKLPYKYGSPQDWSGNLLANCSDSIDYLAEHLYPVTGSAFDVEKQEFVRVDDPLVDRVRRVPNRVRAAAEAWQEYLKRMPDLKDKGITIVLDEWAGGRRGLTRALCAAAGLHEIFRHSGIITMGAYTAATSCVRYNRTHATMSPTGLVFKLYRKHFGTVPVAVGGNSPQRPVKGTVGVDKPQVPSGSDTYPLDMVAALQSDRQALTVAVVNPTEAAHEIRVTFNGVELQGKGRQWQITGSAITASNRPGETPQVTVLQTPLTEVPNNLKIAPISINLYEFETK